MKNFLFVLVYLFYGVGFSQSNWAVMPNSFEHSMSMTAIVIDSNGNAAANLNHEIGVFDGDLCVGLSATDFYMADLDYNLAFITIFSNEPLNTYQIKLFDSDQNLVLDGGSISFVSNEIIGEIANPSVFFMNPDNLVLGCTDNQSLNYNPNANYDDESCVYQIFGCTDESAPNYNSSATLDNGSCLQTVLGCTAAAAINYNVTANMDDGSCFNSWEEAYLSLLAELEVIEDSLFSVGVNSVDITSDNQVAFSQGYTDGVSSVLCPEINLENIPLDLPLGWGMFGYTCVESVDAMEGFTSISENIALVKDEMGSTYFPEYSFNGIGDLIYSKGYQIKTIQEITDFYFCPTVIISE